MTAADRTLAYIKNLTIRKSQLLEEMESFAKAHRIPILDEHAAAVLEWLVTLKADTDALEVGTAIGYSSIRIAAILQGKAKLYTLEKSSESYNSAQQYISRSPVAEKVEVVFGEAADTIKQFQSESFGFIFLDADKKDYTFLLPSLVQLLQPQGILLVDNLLWHGNTVRPDAEIEPGYANSTRLVREFNNQFFAHPQLKTILLPVGDGLGLGIKL